MLTIRRTALAGLVVGAPLLIGQIVFNSAQVQLTPPASTSKPEDQCVLQGRVTNSVTGEPVKKTAIRLIRQRGFSSTGGRVTVPQGYSALSDADGNFRIENIEPGDYRLSGDRSGYLNTEYGEKGPNRRGSIISLRPAQQMTDINLALTPQAVISGKVIDQDGDPVNDAAVNLMGQSWQRGKLVYTPRSQATTNDLGEYRLAGVSPGRYYMLVQTTQSMGNKNAAPAEPGKPDLRPAKTFYPEAPNREAATPLDVRAGQDLSGIDIRQRLAATYHIRGKVVGTLPDGSPDSLNVNASSRDEEDFMFMFGSGSNVAKDRTFDIGGIAPGSYTLNLFAMARRSSKALGRQDVDVGQADVNDVQIAIVPPGTVRGQITVEGNPPAGTPAGGNVKNLSVGLTPANGSRMMFGNDNGTVIEDGTFTIENVTPGRYYLNQNGLPGTYLKSVRFGGQEVLGKEIDLSQGSGQIALIYSYGVAEVDGTVQFQQNASPTDTSSEGQSATTPDAFIALVPDQLNEDGSGMRFGKARPGGAFMMKEVPPGHYRAYALARMDYEQMQNSNVLSQLQSKAIDVDLKENEKKQIQLPLMTEDEIQQIYSRLGIEVPQN